VPERTRGSSDQLLTARGNISRDALAGIGWMCVANLLFAAMTMAARLSSETAPWSMVAASRAVMGVAVAIVFALGRGVTLRTNRPGLTWARSILGTCSMLSTFYALGSASLPVGDAITLMATTPIFIALLSPRMLGERPDGRLWIILLVAFAGVAFVAGPHLLVGLSHGAASNVELPALMAITAAMCSALAMMFLRMMRTSGRGVLPETPEAITLHFSVVASVVLVSITAFVFTWPSPRDMVLLVVTGLTGGLAQLAMTRAYALAEAARLGAVSYLGTVASFVGAVALLGERPEPTQVGGCLLVVGAGVALAMISARQARAARSAESAT
jgi:drug/metabolite transporter (DMT)-like permease